MSRVVLRTALAAAALIGVAGRALPAQIWGRGASGADTGSTRPPSTTRLRPEWRLDYLGARNSAVHAGAGLSIPAGTYVRVGVAAGGGVGWDDGRTFPSARVDLVGRFLIDPFRRSRWGTSLGGGVSVRYDDDDTRALALVLVDVEGPGARGWIPFGGVGLGGGVRVTAGLRRAASTGR